jgi:Fic-DOC domain mobile mystery protein B
MGHVMSEWGKTLHGETPLPDRSGLKIKTIRNRGQLNRAEAENIRQATLKYLAARPSARLAPFTLAWTQRLHAEMFGQVWKWAGRFRTCPVNIGVAPLHIESRLYTLLGDLAVWGQDPMDLLEQAARLHHGAVVIHPFLDGNGRWSRMLANIWLKRQGHPITYWPEEVIGAVSVLRSEYLAAIKAADEGDHGPLTELHRRFLRECG